MMNSVAAAVHVPSLMGPSAISHSAHHPFRKSDPSRSCITIPSLRPLTYNRRLNHHRYDHVCKMSMNGCGHENSMAQNQQLQIIQTRSLEAVSGPSEAIRTLTSALAELSADPPPLSSGIIRLQVTIQQQISALDWLRSQGDQLLPRCFFSSRDPDTDSDAHLIGDPANGNCKLVSVAGVGSAVHFTRIHPFGIDDWRSIRRFLSKESPLIRAYGAIRFDATTVVSSEWKAFGSYYFMIPQVEFDELEESAIMGATVAWDEAVSYTWESARKALQNTMSRISSTICPSRRGFPNTHALSYKHVPSKALWEHGVKRALRIINENDSSLRKVVLARRSMILTSMAVDPIRWLACIQAERANAYQFCLQPPDSPAFIGNTPERLFHRRKLCICSEALAATRARGKSYVQDILIEQDLLSSPKDHLEFSIVQSSIQRKLEAVCSRLMAVPKKSILKLPRVQHIYVKLAGTLGSEDNEFDILSSLHPTPAVCGFPTEEARKIIAETEAFDRGMYAGPVGWFGGEESEFAVGIRSALVDKDLGALLYAGTGIVTGSNPSQEWDELELKTSQEWMLLLNILSKQIVTVKASMADVVRVDADIHFVPWHAITSGEVHENNKPSVRGPPTDMSHSQLPKLVYHNQPIHR